MNLIPPLLGQSRSLVAQGLAGCALPRTLCSWQKQQRQPVVLICDDLKQAHKRTEQLRVFQAEAVILPPPDALPYLGISSHPDLVTQIIGTLDSLARGKYPEFIVTTTKALLHTTVSQNFFRELCFTLHEGDLIERSDLIQTLVRLGFERSPIVEEKGQFAVRGDVLDIFCPQETLPVRITLFDIEIESIKYFEISSQRTSTNLTEIALVPVSQIPLPLLSEISEKSNLVKKNWSSELKKRADTGDIAKAKRDHADDLIKNGMRFHGIDTLLPIFFNTTEFIFDFLPNQSLIVHDISSPYEEQAEKYYRELLQLHENCQTIEKVVKPEEICLTTEALSERLRRYKEIFVSDLSVPEKLKSSIPQWQAGYESNSGLRTSLAARIANIHTLAPLASELNQKRMEGIQCVVFCQNALQLSRIEDLLKRFDLPLTVLATEQRSQLAQGHFAGDGRLVGLIEANLYEGFFHKENREWWITDEEIFGKKTKRTPSRLQKSKVFSSFSDLSEGDYLIHMDHGIGLYRGLVKLDIDPNKNDFLLIEYLDGDRIYVPVDKLSRVQRFISEEGATPALDKLGGTTWIKTREKAKRASRKLAAELLKLQARRLSQVRPAIAPQTELCEEFAASFEFEETADQLQAIEETMQDFDRERPMDRIICGDVGFGKTEVALRAAFRSVSNQKQVALLVPTTVLAFQHYQTFKKRLSNYAIKIELLSRFRSAKEQSEILHRLKEGDVDIVIGTHRLLSNDVKFQDLGLVIVDEEHRFGVVHKEKLKKWRGLIDLLTLTATPIPRTLNLALTGIRDLSIINTPPLDRLAVKTYVCHFDENLLGEALRHELRRGGQIYVVHNRIQSLDRMAARILKIVPEARIRTAHGQMNEEAIEDIMMGFMNKDFDILVTTTIIESGLDIPNANTMIIDRADTFGLSQLYQLRGRIGRSHHQAYCYLITPENDLITDKAKQRLIAIQRHTELGSGFRIASHDLEIRGAGNILGDEQSGHIAAIGYDLYIKMLEDAIREMRNESTPEDFDPEIQIATSARIPDEFIPDKTLRLSLYKQLSAAENENEIRHLEEDWQDRFGRLPEDIGHLFSLMRIRLLCKELLITTLKQRGELIQISLHPQHGIDTSVFADAIKRNPQKFSLSRDGNFQIKQKFNDDNERLKYLLELLEKLKQTK